MTLPFHQMYRHVLTAAWPTDWAAMFDSVRPLVVEIGFGNGDFLIHLAQTRPQHNIVGFETSVISIDKATRRIARASLQNAVVVQGRGETALAHLFRSALLQAVVINNPDPWFKDRHAGRRLIQTDTVRLIAERLVIGGDLYLATDVEEYARMSDAILRDEPALDNQLDQPWVQQMAGRIVTKYEARGLRQGREPHLFHYRRNDHDVEPIPTYEELLPVPHVIIETPHTVSQLVERVEQQTHRANGGDISIKLLTAYANPASHTMLFEVHIAEPTIEQHTAILLLPRDQPDQYIVRYDAIGHPRSTAGMHAATLFLAEWVVSQHEDARIIAASVRE